MGSHSQSFIMIIRSITIITIVAFFIDLSLSDSSEAMKEIKPPNLMLEKIRSLHKRKADFRPHRPSFSQQSFSSHGSSSSSSSYGSPPPPPPAPASSSYGSPPAPAPSGYGSPAAAPVTEYDTPSEDEEIDLHNKEFCVDVSTYQPVVWVKRDGQVCKTDWIKQCEDKTENVCIDVTETVCEVVPYKECKQGLEPQEYSETILTPKKFIEKECIQNKKEIPHKKLLPECKNVTKQNCVTNWETDSYGNQVWAGTEACEPVTWQECKLVPKDVKFIVPEITCNDKQEIWYHEPEDTKDTRMTNTFNCEVKKTSHCRSIQRPDCKQITWNECREAPVKKCNYKKVHLPTQELLHRKKCLLPDAKPESAATDYGGPIAPVLNSYQQPTYNSRRH